MEDVFFINPTASSPFTRFHEGLSAATHFFAALSLQKAESLSDHFDRATSLLLPFTQGPKPLSAAFKTLGDIYLNAGIFLINNAGALDDRSEAQIAAFLFFDHATNYFEQTLRIPPQNTHETHHYVRAAMNLARMNEKGWNAQRAQSPAKVFSYLSLAAHEGSPDAQWRLGKAFRDGQGVEASLTDAVFWLGQAATNDALTAPALMATVKKDFRQAVKALDLAIEMEGLRPSDRRYVQDRAIFGPLDVPSPAKQ